MKRTVILSAAFATLLSAFSQAQAPAPAGAAPAATPPAATPPAATPAPATPAPGTAAAPGTAPAAPKSTKPFPPTDVRALTQIMTAMQFHMKMGETAKWKGKEKNPAVAKFGTDAHKAMVDLWTPLATLAQERKVDNKFIPGEPDKGDKAAIDKMNKAKDEKWADEYYELFAKEGKRYAKNVETATKGITDPDLKKMAESVSKLIATQAAAAETARKEAKQKK